MSIAAMAAIRFSTVFLRQQAVVGKSWPVGEAALLGGIGALIALTQYTFAYWNLAFGVGMALCLAVSLSLLTAFAPLNPALSRCIDSLTLLPLYVLLTSSLPWFLLNQQVLLPAVYYCILVLIYRHLAQRGFTLASVRGLGLRSERWARYLALGVLLGVPTGVLEYAILRPAPEAPTLMLTLLARDLVYMTLFVGLAEELLFRGILQSDLAAVLGWKGGLLFSSVLFSIMHMTWRSGPELAFTFGAGLLLGYLYVRTRSLVGPIALHAVNNIILVSIMPYLFLTGR